MLRRGSSLTFGGRTYHSVRWLQVRIIFHAMVGLEE
jgi:hypothetical protein